MKESPISEDRELREILEKLTFAYKLDDSLWAFDPKELLSAVQSYSQKKYQEGELNGRTALLLDLELKARHEPELTTFEVDRIVGFIDFYKSQLERKEQ